MERLRQRDTWNRFLICLLAAVTLWLMTGGWAPAFPFRERIAPTRNVHARVAFKFDDREATIRARQRARRNVLCYYENKFQDLEDTRQALVDQVFQLTSQTMDEIDLADWSAFQTSGTDFSEFDLRNSLEEFRTNLSKDESLDSVQRALATALRDIERNGLLDGLEHELGEGSMEEILVFPTNNVEDSRRVDVSSVRIASVKADLEQMLIDEFAKESTLIDNTDSIAKMFNNWLQSRLNVTLEYDEDNTNKSILAAENEVETIQEEFLAGDLLENPDTAHIIEAGSPLTLSLIHISEPTRPY